MKQQIKDWRSEFLKSYEDNATVNMEKVADFWLDKFSHQHSQLKEAVEGVYGSLLDIEARMSKEKVNAGYENGYFDAIDDTAKEIKTKLFPLLTNKEEDK